MNFIPDIGFDRYMMSDDMMRMPTVGIALVAVSLRDASHAIVPGATATWIAACSVAVYR
jgi:hypothetical protein